MKFIEEPVPIGIRVCNVPFKLNCGFCPPGHACLPPPRIGMCGKCRRFSFVHKKKGGLTVIYDVGLNKILKYKCN